MLLFIKLGEKSDIRRSCSLRLSRCLSVPLVPLAASSVAFELSSPSSSTSSYLPSNSFPLCSSPWSLLFEWKTITLFTTNVQQTSLTYCNHIVTTVRSLAIRRQFFFATPIAICFANCRRCWMTLYTTVGLNLRRWI